MSGQPRRDNPRVQSDFGPPAASRCAMSAAFSIYWADDLDNVIRSYSNGSMSPLGGRATSDLNDSDVDGTGIHAQFYFPVGDIVVRSELSLYGVLRRNHSDNYFGRGGQHRRRDVCTSAPTTCGRQWRCSFWRWPRTTATPPTAPCWSRTTAAARSGNLFAKTSPGGRSRQDGQLPPEWRKVPAAPTATTCLPTRSLTAPSALPWETAATIVNPIRTITWRIPAPVIRKIA